MYQLVSFTGNDIVSFLQGQLTQDVALLPDSGLLPAAWCNQKGRVVVTMRMLQMADGIGLILPASSAASVVDRLSIYKFRAAVNMDLLHDFGSYALAASDDLDKLTELGLAPVDRVNSIRSKAGLTAVCIATDPMTVEVFGHLPALAELDFAQPLNDVQRASALIRGGTVIIDASNEERYTPHMLSLDLAGAVNFDKGCYLGQEIIARTEHLGKSRRRLMRYECEQCSAIVGDSLLSNDDAVGTIVNLSAGDILAVVPAELHSKTLIIGDRPATPAPLPWS